MRAARESGAVAPSSARSLSPARLLADGPRERAADRSAEAALDERAGPASVRGGAAPPAHAVEGSGAGQPLPDGERSFFEARFGWDFRNVRVHHDGEAAARAATLGARAFTVGSNIFMGAGRLAQGTPAGRRLLAHELAHVTQGGRTVQCKPGDDQPLDPQPVVEHGADGDVVKVRGVAVATIRARSGTLKPTGQASGGYQKLATPFNRAGNSVSLSYTINVEYENAPEDLVVSAAGDPSTLQQRFPSVQFSVVPKGRAAAPPQAAPPPAASAPDARLDDAMGDLAAREDPDRPSPPRRGEPPSAKGLIDAFDRISVSQLRSAVVLGSWRSIDELNSFMNEYIDQARADPRMKRLVVRLEALRDEVLSAYKAAKARYVEGTPARLAEKAEHDARLADAEAGRQTYGEVALESLGKGAVMAGEVMVSIRYPGIGMGLGLTTMATAKDENDPNFVFGALGFFGARAGLNEPNAPAPKTPVAPKAPPEVPVAPKAPADVAVAPKAPPARPAPQTPVDDMPVPGRPRPGAGDGIDTPAPRRPPSPTNPTGGPKVFYSRRGNRVPREQGTTKPQKAESPKPAAPEPASPEAAPPAARASAPRHPALKVEKVEGEAKWEAIDAATQQKIGTAYYDTDGNLRMTINAENQGMRKTRITGTQIHDSLLEASGGLTKPFRAEWRPALPNNLESFNKALLERKSAGEAALSTWTGQRCQERGLTQASIVPGGKRNPPGTKINVRDSKGQPLEPMVDKEGITYESVDILFKPAGAVPH